MNGLLDKNGFFKIGTVTNFAKTVIKICWYPRHIRMCANAMGYVLASEWEGGGLWI